MKNSTFGILATLALALAPAAVFAQQLDSTRSGNPTVAQAQDAQTSIQNNTNSGSAVGDANLILQNATQNSDQLQVGINDYTNPSAQLSVQDNANAGAAVGGYNIVDQNATQGNVQTQIDASQYLPETPDYSTGY